MTGSKSGAWYRRGYYKIPSWLKRYGKNFRCPLCYEGSCEVKMWVYTRLSTGIRWKIGAFFRNRKSKTAEIQCDHCSKEFETSIHRLSAPIDVYTDWVTSLETPSDTRTASFKTPVKEETDEQKMTRSTGSQDSEWDDDASDE